MPSNDRYHKDREDSHLGKPCQKLNCFGTVSRRSEADRERGVTGDDEAVQEGDGGVFEFFEAHGGGGVGVVEVVAYVTLVAKERGPGVAARASIYTLLPLSPKRLFLSDCYIREFRNQHHGRCDGILFNLSCGIQPNTHTSRQP